MASLSVPPYSPEKYQRQHLAVYNMSSVTLDMRTLTFVLLLLSALLSLVMVFVWRTNKTYNGFGWWTLANLAGILGFLLLGLRAQLPDLISIVIANTVACSSMGLTLVGTRRFLGRSGAEVFVGAALLLHAVALAWFTYIDPDTVMRIYVSSGLSAMFGIRCDYEFITVKKNDRLFTTIFAATVHAIFSIFMIGRMALTHIFSNIDNFYSPDWIQSLTFTMFITFLVTWTFNFLMLNSERVQRELKTTQVELEKLATTDFLTSISNNRRFSEISENEMRRARRFNHPLSVIVLDIDRFKEINDTYGHAAGDLVLLRIAEIGKAGLRGVDTIGRLGGDEFGILLPHTDLSGAEIVAETMRVAIEEAVIDSSAGPIKIMASLGIAEMKASDRDIKSILERADALLYEAKRGGRNRAVSDITTRNLLLAPAA